jgi:hypothetical protein
MSRGGQGLAINISGRIRRDVRRQLKLAGPIWVPMNVLLIRASWL